MRENLLEGEDYMIGKGLQTSGVAALCADSDMKVMWMNAQCMSYFSLNYLETIGKNVREVFYPLLGEHDLNILKNQLFLREHFGLSGRYTLKWNAPRELIYTDVNANVIKSEDGKTLGYLVLFVDVTERVQAEQALRERESLLMQVQEIGKTGYWEFDLQTLYVDFSASFAQMLKLPSSRMSLNDITKLIHADDFSLVMERLRVVHENRDPAEMTIRLYTYGTTELKYFFFRSFPEFDANGKIAKKKGVAVEVTSLRVAKSEKESLILQLKSRVQDLQQVNYMASHNLIGPLNNMSSLIAMIRKGGPGTETLLGHLETCVHRMNSTMHELSALLQTKEEAPEPVEAVVLKDLINGTLADYEFEIVAHRIKIAVDIPEGITLNMNRAILHSVFQNLLSNAIKYRSSEREPRISLTCTQAPGLLTIDVSDNGIGIDTLKHGSSIFGLAKRFHNHVPGSGIGLYLVKAQVERLNGSIGLRSEVNKGSTFRITLNV